MWLERSRATCQDAAVGLACEVLIAWAYALRIRQQVKVVALVKPRVEAGWLLVCVRLRVQHPWVTLGGSAPLVSMRQQQMAGGLHAAGVASCTGGGVSGSLEATQEEIDAAIKQIASGGVSELMDVVFEERVLQPG
jgi:hypothetical protein